MIVKASIYSDILHNERANASASEVFVCRGLWDGSRDRYWSQLLRVTNSKLNESITTTTSKH